ncbi:hypothetical protein HUU61_15075, partial [Rhodopseudomonas palustris]|nr:hypothetical protein [Rhodopseudomonas palustris]
LFAQAGEKYQAALAIKPDDHEVLNNWGTVLLEQAKRAGGEEAVLLVADAADKIVSAVNIDPTNTYNLACVRALQGDEQGCRSALENAEKHRTLPPIEHLISDSDLDRVRSTPWFQDLIARRGAQGG